MSTNYISQIRLNDLSNPNMGEETLGMVMDRLFAQIERLENRIALLETAKPNEIDQSDITDRLDDLESKLDDKIDKYDFKNEVEDVVRDLSFSVSID